MEAVRMQHIVENDGEVVVKGTPFKKGQCLEIILFPQTCQAEEETYFTVGDFKKSGLIGLWRDRDEIKDSAAYARNLREHAQKRRNIDYDFAR